jgi:hypothetical protein
MRIFSYYSLQETNLKIRGDLEGVENSKAVSRWAGSSVDAKDSELAHWQLSPPKDGVI